MDSSHIIYFVLSLLVMYVAYKNGKRLSSLNNVKILSFSPVIIAYTLFAGLRWGRGVDYNLYYYVYQEIGKGYNEGWEPFFYAIVRGLSFVGFPWQIMVLFMSFLLILSFCLYLKQFNKHLYVILPLLVLNLNDAENLQRWYLAFSFFLICLYYWHNKIRNQNYLALLFLIASVLTHYGFVIPIMIFAGLWVVSKKYDLNPHIICCIYLACTFLFKTDMMLYFEQYINMFNIGGRFSMYQANASGWLTGEVHAGDNPSNIASLSKIIPNILLIYLGAYWMKTEKDLKYKYIYVLAVFSIVFSPIASQIELLYRVNSVFTIFKVIMIAILYDSYRKRKFKNSIISALILVVFVLKLYTMVSYPLTCDKIDTYFIWDSQGKPTLQRNI